MGNEEDKSPPLVQFFTTIYFAGRWPGCLYIINQNILRLQTIELACLEDMLERHCGFFLLVNKLSLCQFLKPVPQVLHLFNDAALRCASGGAILLHTAPVVPH